MSPHIGGLTVNGILMSSAGGGSDGDEYTVTEDPYGGIEVDTGAYKNRGWVDSDGYLNLDIKTRTENGERIGSLSGTEVFEIIWNRASQQNDIRGIRGYWDYNSTNTQVFHQRLQSGYSVDDAALASPTGKWAQSKGFYEVKFLGSDPFDTPLEFIFK